MITVELYGVPRHRAGRAEIQVEATTVPELLAAIRRACPGLADLVDADGRLARHYLLALDGGRFVADPGQRLTPGSTVLLLSADAGG